MQVMFKLSPIDASWVTVTLWSQMGSTMKENNNKEYDDDDNDDNIKANE